MKRLFIAIIMLCVIASSGFSITFAEVIDEGYQYDDETISFDLEDYDMVPLRERSRESYDEDFDRFFNLFDQNDNLKMVVLTKGSHYYWCFGVENGAETEALSDLPEKEVRTINLTDITPEEEEQFSSNYQIDGFDKEWDGFKSYSGIKYYVCKGSILKDGYSVEGMQYLTILNGYYYTFTLFPLEDSISSEDQKGFVKFLKSIKFTPYSGNNEATEADQDDYTTDEGYFSQERLDSLFDSMASTAILVGVTGAIAILFGLLTRKRKKEKATSEMNEIQVPEVLDDANQLKETIPKGEIATINSNEKDLINVASLLETNTEVSDDHLSEHTSNELTDTRSQTAIPTDELRMLKKLYDSGILTAVEFEEKKKQLLGLK